ncbi:hypothetical protein DFJ69_5951 [Thermomonospora umbrina]|uniref:Uncharacterized protein n=1 Tax=Thermomonospora umbrina TaxID=111806 RepID=A0A3D9T593_9ACTN|nr:hypothetical protein DFJ69_5951 [Thermomonospora umbrina]
MKLIRRVVNKVFAKRRKDPDQADPSIYPMF